MQPDKKHPVRRKRYGTAALLLLMISAAAFSQTTWEQILPLPQNSTLHSSAYGNNTFIIVGENGATMTAPQGGDWTVRQFTEPVNLHAVAFGNNRFVAMSETDTFFYSGNAIDWTVGAAIGITGINALTFGKGKFVAVGTEGGTYVSEDAATWTKTALKQALTLSDAAFGNNIFVAVGYILHTQSNSYHERIATSVDGSTWQLQSSSLSGQLFGIAFIRDYFIVVGRSGSMIRSTDGINWEYIPTPTGNALYAVASGRHNLVAVGDSGVILASSDMETWEIVEQGTTGRLNDVFFDDNRFIAVGDSGMIITSVEDSTFQTGINHTARTRNTISRVSLSIENASDIPVLTVTGRSTSARLQIFSINGQCVYTAPPIRRNRAGAHRFHLTGLSPGTYLAILTDHHGLRTGTGLIISQ